MPLVSYGGSSFPRKRACAEAETLRVGVGAPERAVPPGTPYELSIWEEPPPDQPRPAAPAGVQPGSETFEPADPAEVTSAVDPGPSKPEATPVEPDGAVHVDLPLGEVAWFAVPLAAGEILAVDAACPGRGPGRPGGHLRDPHPLAGRWLRREVLTPAWRLRPGVRPRGVVGTGTTRTQLQTYSTGPGALRLLAAPDFTNGASFDAGPLIATAGVYYVAVHAQDPRRGGRRDPPNDADHADLGPAGAFGAEPEYDGAGPSRCPVRRATSSPSRTTGRGDRRPRPTGRGAGAA